MSSSFWSKDMMDVGGISLFVCLMDVDFIYFMEISMDLNLRCCRPRLFLFQVLGGAAAQQAAYAIAGACPQASATEKDLSRPGLGP